MAKPCSQASRMTSPYTCRVVVGMGIRTLLVCDRRGQSCSLSSLGISLSVLSSFLVSQHCWGAAGTAPESVCQCVYL